MTAIRPVLAFVAALALSLGMAAMAQAQCFGPQGVLYPCYHVFVSTTDGVGDESQTSTSPLTLLQQGSNPNGNQEQALGIAGFGSLGSMTSVDVVACPSNCFAPVAAIADAIYDDAFDPRVGNPDIVAGDFVRYDLSLSGSFGALALASVGGTIELQSGNNLVDGGTGGSLNFLPASSASVSVVWDPSFDPLVYVQLDLTTVTALAPFLGFFGSDFADFSTTFSITNVALLDPSGNFLRNIVLTDTAGFTLPGPGPGPGTAPEPGTLLLVVSALALLGTLSRRMQAN